MEALSQPNIESRDGWMEARRTFPRRTLSIHLTDLCNNRCIFCAADIPSLKGDSVTRESIERFLLDNQDHGYEAVNLHGGEPTARKDFLEILSFIQSLGFSIVIVQTNARKLARPEFANETVARGVSLCVVSIHGQDAATQESISQVKGSFAEAIAGIRNIKRLGCKVRTTTVVARQNLSTLPGIADLLIDLGVDHINISAMQPVGMAYRNFAQVTPTYAEIRDYVAAAVDRAVAAGCLVTLEGFPYCAVPGYEQYTIDWTTQKIKMLFHRLVIEDYEDWTNKCTRTKHDKCKTCAYTRVCGGVYKEYIQFVGWDEFNPPTQIGGAAMPLPTPSSTSLA